MNNSNGDEEFLNVVPLKSTVEEDAWTILEENAPALYHVMASMNAKLDEVVAFKREMEEAINGIQSSGMLGMVSKLLK